MRHSLKRKNVKFFFALLLLAIAYGGKRNSFIDFEKMAAYELNLLSTERNFISEDISFETAQIRSITDGDTIKVKIDGYETVQTVRFLTVDTPESVHSDSSKNTKFGEYASDYTKSKLTVGQTVYLSKDTSDKDRYGRLLRFVWLQRPDDIKSESEIRSKMYNADLILNGYALAKSYKPDVAMYELFEKLQREAMEKEAGLWKDSEWWRFNGEIQP